MSEKEKKICIVVKTFLEHPECSLQEISEMTKIPQSSVQRYLSDKIIIEFFGIETYEKIKEQLRINKENGRKKGGVNSFINNEPIKDETGKFIGSEKSKNKNKLEKKYNDILIFSDIILKNPDLTLQQIADLYNQYKVTDGNYVTRDYVYDCLTVKSLYYGLAENLYELVNEQLKARRIVGNQNGASITNERKQKK